ncbi:hypothetical protein F3I20_00465 [Candidatus Pantoea gossypiicola]|uniref:SWIM-type domain-containing protein n=1 Tax=Candidatus Pantoea gossypiicola TaxID=2608008 RepID=A0AB34CPQ3_9GAMM|nr:hypothetical protein F3I20_00465 [Pantoea gossypiicola]
MRTKNAGSVFEQRHALARLRAHLRDEVRTKNAGSVFEQRHALARLRAHLRDEVRNRAGRAAMEGLSDFPICPCSLHRLGLTGDWGRLCQHSQGTFIPLIIFRQVNHTVVAGDSSAHPPSPQSRIHARRAVHHQG